MKHWGKTRKKAYNDVYVVHGTCTPSMEPKCAVLGEAGSGDGYRGKREWKTDPDAPLARSSGACSQLCMATEGCNYWVVHNAKGCFMYAPPLPPLY